MSTSQNKLYNPEGVPLPGMYLQTLFEGMRSRKAEAAPVQREDAKLTVLQWSMRYRRIEGHPFSLQNHVPLIALYEEVHPDIAVRKPSQVGVSEWLVSVTGHAMDIGAQFYDIPKLGLNVAYIFPTNEALGDFSKERITALRLETPHLTQMFTGWDKVTFKQAGASFLYLRGAKSKAGLKSFPADMVILDEKDEIPDEAVQLAFKRLRHSQLKHKRSVSTPTIEEAGISIDFEKSDQRWWFTPCPHCKEENILDFFRDVYVMGKDFETWRDLEEEQLATSPVTVHCPSCKQQIPDKVRFTEGRYIAKRPHITQKRGYQVPALCFPIVDLNELVVHAASTNPTVFTELMRSDLGLPYAKSGSRIDDAMMKQLCHRLSGGRLPAYYWRDVTAGIDVGARFNIRISGVGPNDQVYVLYMGTVKTYEEIDRLMNQFNVRLAVIDALPEIISTEQWCNRWDGRALRAFYPSTERALKDKLRVVDYLTNSVDINRTAAMDLVFDNVSQARENWPAEFCQQPEIIAQMKAPQRVVGVDAHGQEFVTWNHTTPDHYFHACVYDTVARTLVEPDDGKRYYSRGGRSA